MFHCRYGRVLISMCFSHSNPPLLIWRKSAETFCFENGQDPTVAGVGWKASQNTVKISTFGFRAEAFDLRLLPLKCRGETATMGGPWRFERCCSDVIALVYNSTCFQYWILLGHYCFSMTRIISVDLPNLKPSRASSTPTSRSSFPSGLNHPSIPSTSQVRMAKFNSHQP